MARQVTDRFAALQNTRTADLIEGHPGMKGLRCRVRRIAVDLADDEVVSSRPRLVEQVRVKQAGIASASQRRRNGYPIDVDEPRKPLAEPEIVGAVVLRRMIEGEQERTVPILRA
jgi:hypothetical protein